MAVVCAFCSGPHVWWDCRKKPDGWKPTVKAESKIVAGLRQAVDHASGKELAAVVTTVHVSDGAVVSVKRGRGRPKSIDDMRAYKAAKAREYRKKKAQEAKP